MDDEALYETIKSRRCWLKLLESVDAPARMTWAAGRQPCVVRFDSRPTDLRVGQVVFCADPDGAVIFAITEVLEDGATALHDFDASQARRWLFKVPVRVLAVVGDRGRAPHLRVAAGAAARFSYRPLTSAQAERVYLAVVDAIAVGRRPIDERSS